MYLPLQREANMSELNDLSIADTAVKLKNGEITSEFLTLQLLGKIETTNNLTHAFLHVDAQAAIEAAKQADAEIKSGNIRSLMHGVPCAIKDVYDVKDLATTCHSKLRIEHTATSDATTVHKLKEAGAIILGKLATHEFALGGPSFDLPFPPARNPWNLEYIPGGSSSGSGAAIAAGYTRLTLGTCTGGSIRIPAAWCGAVGLKPTYGRISKYGVFPLSWSLDHCGPITRSVDDAAIALQLLAGHDINDPESAEQIVDDYRINLEKGVSKLKIGVPRQQFSGLAATGEETLKAIDKTLTLLQESGAEVSETTLPEDKLFLACGRVINTAEMYTIHAENLKNRPLDYSELTLPRLALGATVSAQDYINAQRMRRQLMQEVDKLLDVYDVIITAVTLDTAPKFIPTPHFRSWPVQTYAFNVTGHPAISVPLGLSSNGLPLSVQVVGRYFDEATILRVARSIEKLTEWEKIPLPTLS